MPVGTFPNKHGHNPIKLKKATQKGRPTPHGGLAHSCGRRWRPRGLSAKVQAVASLTDTTLDAGSEKRGVQHCHFWFCKLNSPQKMCSCPSGMHPVHLKLWISGMMPTHGKGISTDPNKSPNMDHPHQSLDTAGSFDQAAYTSHPTLPLNRLLFFYIYLFYVFLFFTCIGF